MPSITITSPTNDGDPMPDPIKGTFDLSAIAFEQESLTDTVFIHLVITGAGPHGETQEISGNATVDEDSQTWIFALVDSNVKLNGSYVYTITSQLILTRIYSDTKHSITYNPTFETHLKQIPKKRKKSK